MLITLIRTIILYILVVVSLRLMGKQQIGELQPFEFVVTLMIAELATIPMEDTGIPLLKGVIPIIILLAAQITLSLLSLKNQRFRKLICGAPTILIKNGKIMEKEMAQIRYNINDLLEQLRIKDYPNLTDVEFAILETNGELSVIPRAEKQPVTVKDLNIIAKPVNYPVTLVVDGKVQTQNLREVNYTYDQLLTQLKAFNIQKPAEALIAMLDTSGNFFAQTKEKADAI